MSSELSWPSLFISISVPQCGFFFFTGRALRGWRSQWSGATTVYHQSGEAKSFRYVVGIDNSLERTRGKTAT